MIGAVLLAGVLGTAVQPAEPSAHPPVVAEVKPPAPPAKPPRAEPRVHPAAGRPIKGGLTAEDYKYTLVEGVTPKEIAYYSDGIACYAKIFFPKGFDAAAKPGTPAVVLGQGWAGTHVSIEKYGARLAEHGLVAMVIDYRGWGNSDGYPRLVSPVNLGGGMERDENRHQVVRNATVWIKRTRLLARDQQEDYRNAISYIQGEPGVDASRIGVWGSSFAGGNSVAVAGQDARVKAIVVQIPGIGGNPNGTAPMELQGAMLEDAISRARTGQGNEMWTGFSRQLLVDYEQVVLNRENNTMQWAKNIGQRPFMVIVAEHEELINNERSGKAALEFATGPKEYVVVPGITHFEMYSGEPFEISSGAAVRWFTTHLGVKK
jgi:uncharacterized protein